MNIETIFLSVLNGGLLLAAIVAAGATFIGFLPGGWALRKRAKIRAQLQEQRIARLDEVDRAFFGGFSNAAKALGMTQNPRSGGLPEFIGTIAGVEFSARAERNSLSAMETLGFYPDSHIPITDTEGQAIQIIHGIVQVTGTRDSHALPSQVPTTHAVVPWLQPGMPAALFTGSLPETVLALANFDKRADEWQFPNETLSAKMRRRRTPEATRGLKISFSATQVNLYQSLEDRVPELAPLVGLVGTLIQASAGEQTAQRLRRTAEEQEDAGNQVLARVALAHHPSWERNDEVLLVRSLVQLNPDGHVAEDDRSKLILERVTTELKEAERTPFVTLLSDPDILSVHPLSPLLVSYLCLLDDPRALQALVASLSTSLPEACVAAANHLSGQGHGEALGAIREAAERVGLVDPDQARQLLVQANLLEGKTGIELGGRLTVMNPVDMGQLSLEKSAGALAMSAPQHAEGSRAVSSEEVAEAPEAPRPPRQKTTA